MRVDNTRSRWPNGNEGAVEGGIDDWGEVVTRYPYGNVGMDHLLSKEKRKTLEKKYCLVLSVKAQRKRSLKTEYNETIERKV